jgi:hypothetical protein
MTYFHTCVGCKLKVRAKSLRLVPDIIQQAHDADIERRIKERAAR